MPLNDALRNRAHDLINTLNSHRILLYSFVSIFAVSAVVANALRNYSNFYSLAISLSKSNRSVLALANFGFLIALLCGHIVQMIFFGSLRPSEVERLYDRLWFFITESLLAFTIFRDDFDIPFALMFGFLLFVKSFHWLASDRIEWMDQRPYPGPSPWFHLRMSTLFLILWMTDLVMFLIAVEDTIAKGVGGMVLFASEYGILMASALNTISKYILSAYELRRAGQRGGENAPPWENKSMWVFYIELATDFLKLTTYLVFFIIIIAFYGIPLNIIRDVYITARSFLTRLRALHRYQTATRNMDQKYPNATAEELASMSDHTCIICREEMVLRESTQDQRQAPAALDGPNTTPKKLPCGHIFHFHCLRSWLERQQSCPTCRRTVLDTPQDQDTTAPAAPAPADPQRPNPGAQNQNQPGVINPLGNPLGLMGRLFGPPAQPPAIPQFAQAQFPQNQHNTPQHAGNLPGQMPPGVIIQYHIQYQVPRHPQPNTAQPPLQPVPPFPGFLGPGGVQQPWPANPQATPRVPTPIADEENAVPPTANPLEPTEPTPISSRDNDSAPTPREAAALAALRRLDSNNHRPSNSRDPQVTQTRPTEATPRPISPGATSTNNLSATSNNLPPVSAPPLIPLYDYSTFDSGTVGGSTSLPVNGMGRPPLSQPAENPRTGNFRQHPRVIPPQSPYSSAQIPLPPTLTDEQLATMDRVTRDAIDERLRILEGVSGAVHRCIEDLMRMRSALPSSTPTAPTIQPVLSINPELSRSSRENAGTHQVEFHPSNTSPTPGPSGLKSHENDVPIIATDKASTGTIPPNVPANNGSEQ